MSARNPMVSHPKSDAELRDFLRQSNMIEGIIRPVKDREVAAASAFLERAVVTVGSLVEVVSAFEPEARLRDKPGLNVRIGTHYPPLGGQGIVSALEELLSMVNRGLPTPWEAHQRYESLHPFTDGNGRSGRLLWAWHMEAIGETWWKHLPLGFLHCFYYQTLQGARDAQAD